MSDNKMIVESSIKSIWTSPLTNEVGAAEKRIVHSKYFKLTAKCERARLGLKSFLGYFKCGSDNATDYIEDFELFGESVNGWIKLMYKTDVQKPEMDKTDWIDVPGGYSAYCVTIRKSGIDAWLPCYNIAYGCVSMEAFGIESTRRVKRNLHKVIISNSAQENDNLQLTSLSAKYTTPYYSIGFRTKSAGLDFLALDGFGTGKIQINLLSLGSLIWDYFNNFYTQGIIIDPVSSYSISDFMAYELEGETIVNENTLTYKTFSPLLELSTDLIFTMYSDHIDILINRLAKQRINLLDSSPFRIAFSSNKTPVTALGGIIKEGETGMISCPATIHFPGYTSLRVTSDSSTIKFNSIRANASNTINFTCGEKPLDNGCYVIEPGEYKTGISIEVGNFCHIPLAEGTPDNVKKAMSVYLYSGLPFRADVSTFTNNGNSIGAPICMDLWSDLCEAIGDGPFGINSFEFLRSTLEIHLHGAPAYASGIHPSGDHYYEDEYIMTGTAVLYGIAKYLICSDDNEWWNVFKSLISDKLDRMRHRDIDNDGLVESTIRKGISGEHQWSTNWYDVVSYGYKDAFSNAILYKALVMLSDKLKDFNETGLAIELQNWAELLQKTYIETFMTPNGWFAGWKCAEGKLHDYGFLALNGAAITNGILEGEAARKVIENLWNALLETGFDSFDAGLPGNIYDINYDDNAGAAGVPPMGSYQNGGLTLSQSRHFISALYTVGMTEEADYVISEISKGLLYGNVVNGTGSGVDWKTWDGVSSGYEGILCDQFGVFVPLIKRYRA